MRLESLLVVTALTLALGGCNTDSSKSPADETAMTSHEAGALAPRDLTLRTSSTPALEVASPVELSRPSLPSPRRAARKLSRKPAPATVPEQPPEAAPALAAAIPVPATVVDEVAADPVPVEDVSTGSGRELAPGKTVTIVPASAGPSTASPEDDSWGASARVHCGTVIRGGGGGGRCKPRGGARGIGIAGRIPVGVPGLRLR